MANKVTRTIKERTAEVTYINDACELEKAVAVIYGNKVNYTEIANQLHIDMLSICEVDATEKFRERKTEMGIIEFIHNAEFITPYKYNDDGEPVYKREPGYFYRNIKAEQFVYICYDMVDKKLVKVAEPKEVKIGKISDNLKFMKLESHDTRDNMYRMSDKVWAELATVVE